MTSARAALQRKQAMQLPTVLIVAGFLISGGAGEYIL